MNTAITKNKTSAMRLIMLLLCLSILLTPQLTCAAMAEPIIIYEDPDLIGNIEDDMSEVVTDLPETGTPTQAPTKEPTELDSNYWFVGTLLGSLVGIMAANKGSGSWKGK